MTEIESLLREVVARLAKDPRVRHAEVRFTEETTEIVRLRAATTGRNDQVASASSRGVGIRVLGSRTWGFATSASLDPADVARAAERATAIADASSKVAKRAVPFPPAPGVTGTYTTSLAIDPFTVPLEEKLALLDAPLGILLGAPVARSAEARMEWHRTRKILATTEGTFVEQSIIHGACGMHVTCVDDAGDAETRSYPTWFGGDSFQGGFETARALDLAGNAERTREEAAALLEAPICPSGEMDLILDSSQVGLQIHESCGHPTELDRVFGTEITLAGGSFLDPKKLGSFRYGSDVVTLTADSIAPGGLGTFGWDDEGTPAGKHVLVDRGLFTDYLSSRETAAEIGRTSTGTMRASGWDRIPLIRMTNVSLAPGNAGTLDDLIADTKRGILMVTDRSWSIDDQRLDFHFSCELAWEIENGKRTRLLKRPLYAGTTPIFWGSCDAVCDEREWKLWGIASCGKGDPIQTIGVGHGAAPARFKKVRVGSAS